jgi:hypothetical protein
MSFARNLTAALACAAFTLQWYNYGKMTAVWGGRSAAFENTRSVVELEKYLGIGVEGAIQSVAIARFPAAIRFCNVYYTAMHVPCTCLAAGLIRRRVDAKEKYATFLLMLWTSLFVYVAFPMLPPRLYESNAQSFSDTLSATSYSSQFQLVGNPYAAMPSMHVGFAAWSGAALCHRFPKFSRSHVWITAVATILTANHFVLDIVAGWLCFRLSECAIAVIVYCVRAHRAALLRLKPHLTPRAGKWYAFAFVLFALRSGGYRILQADVLPYRDSFSDAESFPHVIHQSYKTDELPPHWRDTPATWREFHPEYEYRFWTDEDNRRLVETQYPHLLDAYDAFPYGIERADLARLLVLHAHGGVYADLDLLPTRSLDSIIERAFRTSGNDLVLLETPNAPFRGVPSNGFMVAAKNSRSISRVLASIEASREYWWLPRHVRVLLAAGPWRVWSALGRTVALMPRDVMGPTCVCSTERGEYALRRVAGQSWEKFDSTILKFANCHVAALAWIVAVCLASCAPRRDDGKKTLPLSTAPKELAGCPLRIKAVVAVALVLML